MICLQTVKENIVKYMISAKETIHCHHDNIVCARLDGPAEREYS